MTQRDEVARVVRGQVAQVLGVSDAEVQEHTDLRTDYDVDSLELMEIGTRLERELGIRLAASDLVELKNVGDAVELLHTKLRGAT